MSDEYVSVVLCCRTICRSPMSGRKFDRRRDIFGAGGQNFPDQVSRWNRGRDARGAVVCQILTLDQGLSDLALIRAYQLVKLGVKISSDQMLLHLSASRRICSVSGRCRKSYVAI